MMKKRQTKLWLYMGRRDGRGVRILSLLSGPQQPPARVKDIVSLRLPENLHIKVEKVIEENRMMWEVWIESADNYETLRDRLKIRGYTRTPVDGTPEFLDPGVFPLVDTTSLPKAKTMLRKKS